MNQMIVGISDCKVSNDPDSELLTYALGSCIAVIAHDPVSTVGGMLHFMLPEASLDQTKAQQSPCMFADTGIATLLNMICQQGANRRRLVVRIAGGAQILDDHELFQIGHRNCLAARKLLWKAGVLVAGEIVGGNASRTVRLEVGTGRAWVREGGGSEQPLPASRASAKGV